MNMLMWRSFDRYVDGISGNVRILPQGCVDDLNHCDIVEKGRVINGGANGKRIAQQLVLRLPSGILAIKSSNIGGNALLHSSSAGRGNCPGRTQYPFFIISSTCCWTVFVIRNLHIEVPIAQVWK